MGDSKNEKQSKWKISSHTLTIVYIILVCVGYTEKSIFYEKFGIEIASYLNFEEYLFIFLPLGSALVLIFFTFSTYITGVLGANYALFDNINVFNFDTHEEKEKKKSKLRIISKKTKRIRTVLAYILIGFVLLMPISLVLYFGLPRDDFRQEVKLTLGFKIAIIIWAFTMLTLFIYKSVKDEDNPKRAFLLYAFFMAFIVPIFWWTKIHKADNILEGKSYTSVSFTINKQLIKTNDTLIFIGQTKEYLFLRNLKVNGNIIYKKNDINQIEIIKKDSLSIKKKL